jgi:hypothetical protein
MWSAVGGLSRRAVAVRDVLAASGEDEVVFVDLGNVASGDPLTGPIINEALYEDMRRTGFSVINVGVDDAFRGLDELLAMAEGTGARLLSANVVYHDSGAPLFEPYVVVGGDGTPRVAILGLTRPDPTIILAGERNRTVLVESPVDAAARWMPVIREEADHVVAIGDLYLHDANRVLRQVPEILAVMMPGTNDAPDEIEPESRGPVTFGDEGRQILVYRVGPEGDTRARRVTLLGEMEADPDVEAWLQPVLDRANQALRDGHRDVEARPRDERYAGPEACGSCHQREYAIWSGGAHARAFESLVAVHREWTPACNVCHVTGAGEGEAWIDPARTPQMLGVQCEVCHAQGAEHAASPGPGYGFVEPRICKACHRGELSPGFVFEEAWPRIRH